MLTGTPKILRPNYKLVTAPTTEPVELADFHSHSQTAGLGQDSKITAFLKTARLEAEAFCGRAFITQTWLAAYDVMGPGPTDEFWYTDSPRVRRGETLPRIIELPRPPLISVSAITYFLDDGVEATQTLAATEYRTSTNGLFGRLALKTGKTWPVGLRPMDSLIITYTAGYGSTAASVPQDIKDAIVEWAAHMYENREGQQAANAGGAVVLNRGAFIPAGVQSKLNAYKVPKI
jgi:uncharacterized phiE125 gp8 family phage protein